MNLWDDIKIRFRSGDTLLRIIFINIAVFLIINLALLIFWAAGLNDARLQWVIEKFEFAEYLPILLYQPWSAITHMFMHIGFGHIFWNMLLFYWIGQIFTEYLGGKKLLSVYLLGGLFAIFFQVLIMNVVPALRVYVTPGSYALGASASVNACLVAIATLIPDYTVFLLLLGPVRLKYIAATVVVISLINIPNGNAGGEIAHIGGALFGFIYTKQLRQGNDLGGWLTKFFEKITRPKSRSRMRVERSRRTVTDEAYKESKKYDEETIDRILDKISKSGYSSLTKEEKEILFSVSDKNKQE
ncbi:MAG: rhomboid family intramembrane serine protease [Bacteroidia bacterium]